MRCVSDSLEYFIRPIDTSREKASRKMNCHSCRLFFFVAKRSEKCFKHKENAPMEYDLRFIFLCGYKTFHVCICQSRVKWYCLHQGNKYIVKKYMFVIYTLLYKITYLWCWLLYFLNKLWPSSQMPS